MSNTARRFNAVFGLAAVTGLVTCDEAILSFKTVDAANAAVVKLGLGRVSQAFTGAWLVTMSRTEIESKIVSLKAVVR